MTEADAIAAYSRGELTAIEVRKRLDGATYGEILRRLGALGLSLPRASTVGREAQIARARSWLFPAHGT